MATVPVPQNVDLSETRQPQLYASTITTYILALLALGARFLSRRLLKSGYRLDDYFAVAATVIPVKRSTTIRVLMRYTVSSDWVCGQHPRL